MQTFEAQLIKDTKPNVYTRIFMPFSVLEIWGVKVSLPVFVTLDGISFESTLVPAGNGRHSLIVSGVMQKKIGKEAGDTVAVTVEKGEIPLKNVIPEDFENALENNLFAKTFFFEKLPRSRQKALLRYIFEAKTVETRLNRIEKICAKMAELERNGAKKGASMWYDS